MSGGVDRPRFVLRLRSSIDHIFRLRRRSPPAPFSCHWPGPALRMWAKINAAEVQQTNRVNLMQIDMLSLGVLQTLEAVVLSSSRAAGLLVSAADKAHQKVALAAGDWLPTVAQVAAISSMFRTLAFLSPRQSRRSLWRDSVLLFSQVIPIALPPTP